MTGVERERAGEIGGRQPLPVGKLVEDPDLAEAELAPQMVLVEEPESSRVEAVEPTNHLHAFQRSTHGCIRQPNACFCQPTAAKSSRPWTARHPSCATADPPSRTAERFCTSCTAPGPETLAQGARTARRPPTHEWHHPRGGHLPPPNPEPLPQAAE